MLRHMVMVVLIVVGLLVEAVSAQSLYDWNLKANWDASYAIDAESAWGHPGGRSGVTLHYHRFVVLPQERQVAAALVAGLGWNASSVVHVVNCGFGWLLEALADHAVTDTTCSTTSTYIQNNKLLTEDIDLAAAINSVGLVQNVGDGLTLFTTFRGDGSARSRRAGDIIDSDVSTTASRRTIRDRISRNGFDVITHECFLNSHTDAEAITLSSRLHALQGVGRVIHIVCPSWANFKTIDAWKAFLPNDTFVEYGTFEVR